MQRAAAVLVLLLLAAPSHASPRTGANHHLGDDSFVAAFGRLPVDGVDTEAMRMATHLTYVRALLGSRPATRPELTERRAQLLSYLDDYIAKGTTPINTRLPWRSPVFIDELGNICAVGYLIERSVGRALPERIAATHRHDFLEDIAAAMPRVRDWVAASGLTLEELASIQPAYDGFDLPEAEQWVAWKPWSLRDGRHTETDMAERKLRGRILDKQMEGLWTRKTKDGKLVGKGTFTAGEGTWKSFHDDGSVMAKGPYVGSRPQGTWLFFFQSGNLAAEGHLERGQRAGRWTFYYDTKARTPIAAGRFERAAVAGRWEHFDAAGKLVAVSRDVRPAKWAQATGHLLTIVPGEDRVERQIHEDTRRDFDRLESLALAGERIYVGAPNYARTYELIFDAGGHQYTRLAADWYVADCHWSRAEKRAAERGELARLHTLLTRVDENHEVIAHTCDPSVPASAERAKQIDALLATRATNRSPSPAYVQQLARRAFGGPQAEIDADLTKVLADNMRTYNAWPHINGLFEDVLPTLAGSRPYLDLNL